MKLSFFIKTKFIWNVIISDNNQVLVLSLIIIVNITVIINIVNYYRNIID